jgi:hypothetical protein
MRLQTRPKSCQIKGLDHSNPLLKYECKEINTMTIIDTDDDRTHNLESAKPIVNR